MKKIDKSAYQARLDRITELFENMATHATEQSSFRCPYKNRFNECTAVFGCRNQRKPKKENGLLLCGGDDKLNYQNAWEEGQKPSYHLGWDQSKQAKNESNTTSTQTMNINQTVFDLADSLAVKIPTSCFRTGICHECIVEINQGMEGLVPRTESESFLEGDYRLACQAQVINPDINITFTPLHRKPKILTLAKEKDIALEPVVERHGDNVLYDGEVIDQYRGNLYGLAIDLGTTTVVINFINLETGQSVHLRSFENPQRFGGSSIMHRISYDGKYEGELRKAIINAINKEIEDWCNQAGIRRQEIYEIVVAGNTTMRELFFRLNVQSIGQKPYKSLIEKEYLSGARQTTSLTIGTRRLGLRANPKARVYGAPIIASHVGGDVASDMVAVELATRPGISMLVDVGTNTEVVVAGNGRIITASCPAGPAFEGGGIKYGMPGYEGAIESIKWQDGSFNYNTIGNTAPVGICGSGLIDLLAELRTHNMMRPKGVFSDRKQYELSIVNHAGISFSRQDASNLAQAKAANYCGQYIVMRAFGVSPSQVDQLFLAGGFANYVDINNAIAIGFLPPVPEERIIKVGNASVQGAREILLSRSQRQSINELVRNIEHIELETTPDFFDIFVEACQFKPMPKVLT